MNLAGFALVSRTVRGLAGACALVALAAASPVAFAQEDLPGRVGRVSNVAGELFTFDGKTLAHRRRRIARRPNCLLCGDAERITDIQPTRYSAGVNACLPS